MSVFNREKYPEPDTAFSAPYDGRNEQHEPSQGYQKMEPDYTARPYGGVPFWQRFAYPPVIDGEHPGEMKMVRIGLQNAVGSRYQMVPTGKTVPLSAFIVNPFQRTDYSGRSGFTTVQPSVQIANGQATVALPATIRRDRERF